ncbi:hypothetical protein B0I35DRAFT_349067 [Stachybotrys elegans]|uniref:NECAP PHear domain-containing protein n=1 Tax=Stachybotrys elegans TaxID=80388 RepID=A0A8K0SXI8_9HYPO|nr:hypothetical protein B0I35DRAFT_349067 [Stachybotrys elegans]
MELLDPATGQPLPNDAIQRVLFVANSVHIYNIPPLNSTRGHVAAQWTAEPSRHIFTARVRVIETAQDSPSAATTDSSSSVKVDLVLEDSSSGQLFAAAPYVLPAVVEPVVDSSRFFALTVRDPSGRKALVGIGFEDRSEAFDFSVALQEARRSLGWEAPPHAADAKKKDGDRPRDYSLKDGETITINLGGSKFGRRRPEQATSSPAAAGDLQSFALAPPPSAGASSFSSSSASSLSAAPSSSGGFSLPPPPGSRRQQSAKDLGFDDGKFGEFA